MTYTGGNLSYLGGGLVEGAFKEWVYISTDTIQTILGSGYVSDAALAAGGRGMSVGDVVYVINQSGPAAWVLQVQSISNGAATLGVPPNAPGETTMFGGSALGANFSTFAEEGNLYRNVANPIASNGADTTDDLLDGFVLPAGAFDVAKRGLQLSFAGKFGATANNKKVRLWFNPTMSGQTVTNGVISGGTVTGAGAGVMAYDSTAQTGNAVGWELQAQLFKYGAAGSNTQFFQLQPIFGVTHGGITAPSFLTLPENAPISVVLTGSSSTTGAAADVVLNWSEANAMN
jgi:hypothetical protein